MELPAVEVTELVGDDKAYFHVPPSRPGVEDAVMIGATLMVALTDRPEVRAVVDAISHPEKTAVVIEAGAPAISSANLRFDGGGLELNAPSRQLIEDMHRAVESDTLRFDASAQMPEPVWRAFNRGMLTLLDELLGEEDAATIDRVLDRVLSGIDDAWDTHRAGQPD